MNRGDKTKQS